jgi:chaperonin cofactor prefoldin
MERPRELQEILNRIEEIEKKLNRYESWLRNLQSRLEELERG